MLTTEQGARLLGAGGEADVFTVPGRPDLAEKRWRSPSPAQARKLAVMLAHPPEGATVAGHVNLAWPTSAVHDAGGKILGFRMPAVDLDRSVPLFTAYNPDARRSRLPGISWLHLVRTARNLASVVAALHRAGYVVGDINESNVLVDRRALVTILDCDSIQVVDPETGEIHHCGVARPEFLARELTGRDLSSTTRRISSDRFALGVMIFLLLREGLHPYAGVWRGRGEPPDLTARMRGRRFPYLPGTSMRPPPRALGMSHLGSRLRWRLIRLFFLGPAFRSQRPSAQSWESTLAALERRLVTCERSPSHSHRRRRKCPWCRRVDAGLADSFPAADGTTVAPRPTPWLRRSMRRAGRRLRSWSGAAGPWAWRRTEPLRRVVPAISGVVALVAYAPFPTVAAIGMLFVTVRLRRGSTRRAVAAIWGWRTALVRRVRPPYWFALGTVCLLADRILTPPWHWPLV